MTIVRKEWEGLPLCAWFTEITPPVFLVRFVYITCPWPTFHAQGTMFIIPPNEVVSLSVNPSVDASIKVKCFSCINAFPLHPSSWHFTYKLPICQGYRCVVLLLYGYWKWFMVHNCFPFTPIIMKNHSQTPNESRICPIDFWIKKAKSPCTDYWKELCSLCFVCHFVIDTYVVVL